MDPMITARYPEEDEAEGSEGWWAAQAAIALGAGADEVRIEMQLQDLDAAIAGTSPDELAQLRQMVEVRA